MRAKPRFPGCQHPITAETTTAVCSPQDMADNLRTQPAAPRAVSSAPSHHPTPNQALGDTSVGAPIESAMRSQQGAQARCLDLSALFPGYRIDRSDEWNLNDRGDLDWFKQLRCRYGFISPFGGDLLQAVTDHRKIGTRLRRLPFLAHVRGDEEVVVRFHVDHVALVLAILKPRKRRVLDPLQRRVLSERGTKALGEYRARQQRRVDHTDPHPTRRASRR